MICKVSGCTQPASEKTSRCAKHQRAYLKRIGATKAVFPKRKLPPGFVELEQRVLAAGAEREPAGSLAEMFGSTMKPRPLHYERKPWTCRCNVEHAADVGSCSRCKDTPPWPPKALEDRWNAGLAPSYPEHEKLRAVADKSQKCGEFFEWLTERYTPGEYHSHTKACIHADRFSCGNSTNTLYPTQVNIIKLLAEFFEIDEARLEEEKRAMLEKLQR